MITINIRIISILILLQYNTSVYCQPINDSSSVWVIKITNTKLANFYKINDSIYRSEQPRNLDFKMIDSIGIKSVLNLRSSQTDSDYINKLTLNLYNVEMLPYNFDDKEIIKALRILMYSPKPIVVHCLYGSDRTGVVIAMYRIIFQNWTKEQALNEMENGGYGFHKIYFNIPHYIRNANIEKLKKEISD